MKVTLFFLIILSANITIAQKNKFKNEKLYKRDSTIYKYSPVESNERTDLFKEILINSSNKKDESTEVDWQIEKELLLKNNDLIAVKNIFLTRQEAHNSSLDFLFESSRNKILGPYYSEYGTFRFVEISYNTSTRKASWGLSGDGLDYSWEVLSKKKGTFKQLNQAAKKLINFYNKGKGNYSFISRRIKRFKADKKGKIDFVDLPENKKVIEKLSSGQHYLIVQHPKGIAVLRVDKRSSNYESVRYTEYIIF